jgi:hypothetical protein
VHILPLVNNPDLAEFRSKNDPSKTFFWIWSGIEGNVDDPVWADGPNLTGAPFKWTEPDCEPTFEQQTPCAIGYAVDTYYPFFPFRLTFDLIITPIENLFEPAG